MARMTREEKETIYRNVLTSDGDKTVIEDSVTRLRGDDEEMEREINDRIRERDEARSKMEELTEAGRKWKERYDTLSQRYATMFLRGTDEALDEQRRDIREDDVEDNVEWRNIFEEGGQRRMAEREEREERK